MRCSSTNQSLDESSEALIMENVIEALLNGYDTPVFLSDAHRGTILFTNEVAQQKLGTSSKDLAGTPLNGLFQEDEVIRQQSFFEHDDACYLVQNEELTLSGTEYIKSVLTPFPEESMFHYLDFQKELTGRLVHRLRSPLNGISGFSGLLKNSSLNDKQLQYVNAIESGLNDMASVLSQIQVLAEPVTVHKTRVDFHLLAEQALESLPEQQKECINILFDKDLEQKQTDFILLKSIVEEMLLNAIQHGTDIHSVITLHFKKDRIRIHNEGPPIPELLASKIFYPFFSGKARNVGVGLAKCATYAHHLGLELELARNSDQEGVSFDIIF